MAQPISPTLDTLIAGDGFLVANWVNSPYININNAYLLVVNRTNYSDIQYIYLTETQALEQTYKISGLLNGVEYMVQYTQTQFSPDGEQGSSGTQLGIPLATPSPPVILDDDLHPIIVDYDEIDQVYTVKLYVDYGTVAYSPSLEQTIFKLVGQTSAVISSVLFTITSGPAQYVQYTFPNLTADTYAISCFNVNNNGVGALSNVMTVYVGQEPFVADVTNVVSGQDGKLTVTVDTPQNGNSNILSIELYYSTDANPAWTLGATILNTNFPSTGTIIATGDIMGLVNGTGYYVKAVAVNANGSGASGLEGTGVPAIQSDVVSVTIQSASTSGTVAATWAYNQGTFQTVLSYNYILYQGISEIANGSVSTNSVVINNLSLTAGASLELQVTPVDTVTGVLSFWTEPALSGSAIPADQWVGSAVTSDPFIVNDLPNAPTDFRCISSSSGSLTYEWTPSEGSGFNDATSYTITIYLGGVFVTSETRDVNSQFTPVNAFSLLTNNTSYTAEIYASNAYGDSDIVTTGPNQPLADVAAVTAFVGPIQGQPTAPGIYPISTNWADFDQEGYTLVNYTVKVYQVVPGGTDIVLETATTQLSQYTYNGAVQGTSYYFGVVTTASENQFVSSTAFSSEGVTSPVEIGATPYINPANVMFGTDDNGNGTITFTVDNNGSNLSGLISYVPPASGSPNPIQAPPQDYSPFINAPGPQTYTTNLGYQIASSNIPYLIYACNGVGGSYITANLD